MLEKRGDDAIGGGSASGAGGHVGLHIDEKAVPPNAEVVEARVYCLPEGAPHSVTINGELFELECGGADRAEVIELEAAALRETGRLEAEMNLDGSSGAAEWAIIVEAVQP
ncbi:hypothetical protein GCM10008096_02520 [Zhihengliuella salsuginis]|uniref:Uncharacterized protein n=1 Tax=Zhihengliuella salsuginis TaxID=578222 RepID=A0ABQ3GBZ2_9MICC|nr:hypothetical protein GCM10008096_02520 [Zhihengliuella salsuginis]